MKFLFIHQNFPGQFLHIVRHLASKEDHQVVFITQHQTNRLDNVELIGYTPFREANPGTHHYIADLEKGIVAGQCVYEICLGLKRRGFRPDIIIGHTGWGETLYVKDVWSDVPLLGYFEFYYRMQGADVGFDPAEPITLDDAPRIRTKNAIGHLSFDGADWGLTPTQWQWSLYPERMRRRISVIHEGVDTEFVQPNPDAWLQVSPGQRITRRDEVVTYVARNLEPYRGFHIFMRSLPELLRRRPDAHVLIVGGDGVSYGPRPPSGCFRDIMLREVAGIDLSRVHFLGHLNYTLYLNILQVSAVHVYLTYPFVLSWSFLEALAAGCAVVGAATPPVQEYLRDGENGLLVDFFDPHAVCQRVCDVLDHHDRMLAMRRRARDMVVRELDVKTVTLPRHLSLIDRLIRNVAEVDEGQ
ncbi:glycosyltransferase family 4 protein [Azospirillum halopraeferens]|uniref:glycosyltransferase family 4 protein n=1 Tax=Azospirillum halopraeferens TaxID=34010 RepID=UPI000422B3BC|nr:glycosyltransferase family 4 protein [Azospirillum halopraeferens]